jgi:hypothetical protein
MENDTMNPASSSKALFEWHPQRVPLGIQDCLRTLSLVLQIVTPKVAEVLGGIDR